MLAARTFFDALAADVRPEFGDPQEVARQLGEILASAQRRWPGVDISPEEFLPYLAQRVEVGGLDQLHADDLYLTCACMMERPEAIVLFRDHLLRPAVRGALAGRPGAEDLVQQLLARLLVKPADGPARIEQYAGRGSLKAWVRVAVMRTLKSAQRTRARRPRAVETAMDLLQDPEMRDPEFDEIRHQFGSVFGEAFTAAVAGLSSHDRRVLRQHHLEGLTLGQMAKIYAVHRVTAARRLAKARERLLCATKHELAARLGLSDEDFRRVVASILSRVQLSMDRLLGSRDDL